jgi:glycogen(starch) synthase
VRILTVGNRYPPWSVGGYETTWGSAVGALRAAGHPTFVLTTLPDPADRAEPSAPPPADVGRELAWYWRAHAFPHRSPRDCLLLEQGNARALAARIQEWRPEVVLWWAMGGMSLSLLEQVRRAGLPAVAVVGDDWPAYAPRVDGWTRCWRRPLARPAAPVAERLTGVPARLDLDRAARWTFVSDHMLAAARAAGWRLPDAVVHHPGVDPGQFAPAPSQPWGWRLLYCGRIDPRKGIETAIRALALLPAGATLTIHGDGDRAHAATLRALAGELGVAGRVGFTVSDHAGVADVYRVCDVLVFPVTWSEPWGLVPLEAMAIGRPVVASRAGGGPAEYLEDGRNCLQFGPGDAPGLAAALQRLAASEELRATLVRGGAATAGRLSERAFHEALLTELEKSVAAGAIT